MPKKPRRNWRAVGLAMPDVERWYRSRASRNANSADVNLGNLLRSLAGFRGKVPGDLLRMQQEELDEYMQDLVEAYLRRLRGSTVKKYVESIKSYLAWHRRALVRPLAIPGGDDNPVAEAQTIPDQGKVGDLLAACDLRTSAMVVLEAHAGVRPQVIGKFDGSDGLVLGDFPELVLGRDGPRFEKVPTLIRVRKNLSKTRKAYPTFLGPQGCEVLIAYWKSRKAAGETLTATSAAVTYELKDAKQGCFLRRGNLQDSVRVRMRRVGIEASSYILRAYFDNRVLMAEAHGVPALYREFWMGHKGGMQMRYALRKEQLPADVVEDMRRAYGKALPYLETNRVQGEDSMLPLARVLLQVDGYTETQLADLQLESKSKQELIGLLARPNGTKGTRAEPSQKVVTSDGLEEALLKGWTYRALLPDGRAIVEKVA